MKREASYTINDDEKRISFIVVYGEHYKNVGGTVNGRPVLASRVDNKKHVTKTWIKEWFALRGVDIDKKNIVCVKGEPEYKVKEEKKETDKKEKKTE